MRRISPNDIGKTHILSHLQAVNTNFFDRLPGQDPARTLENDKRVRTIKLLKGHRAHVTRRLGAIQRCILLLKGRVESKPVGVTLE